MRIRLLGSGTPTPSLRRMSSGYLEALPPWLLVKTSLAKSASETKPTEIELPVLNTAPSRADAAIAQLLRLEKFEADWDGSEAAKPLDYSIKEARLFIRNLSPESIMPRATLHAGWSRHSIRAGAGPLRRDRVSWRQ
jgi:hypothetical protein